MFGEVQNLFSGVFISDYALLWLFLYQLFGAFGICLYPLSCSQLRAYMFGFYTFLFVLILNLLWGSDLTQPGFNFLCKIPTPGFTASAVFFGVDGLSFIFINLTCFVFFICFINELSDDIKYIKVWYFIMISVQMLLILCFCVLDIFFFYICFESLLLPMFLVIGVWGSRLRRVKASLFLVMYTLFGSFFLLIGILLIFIYEGTTSLLVLANFGILTSKNLIIWFFLFIGFAVKVPMVPFHIWLPEAHVEAPTTGSILLAALILKLGGFGFIRFVLPLTTWVSFFLIKYLLWFSILGVIISNIAALRQPDLKKLIAYSSIGHMNFSLLGIFSFTYTGIYGGLYLMIGHTFISSGLFLLVGILYKRFHTKIHSYLTGLLNVMPLFCFFFFFFILANFSFPFTANFVGEVLIMFGIIRFSRLFFLLLFFGLVLCTVYSLFVFNRICLGTLNTTYKLHYKDLKIEELWCLTILMILTLIIGISPHLLLNYIIFSEYILGFYV